MTGRSGLVDERGAGVRSGGYVAGIQRAGRHSRGRGLPVRSWSARTNVGRNVVAAEGARRGAVSGENMRTGWEESVNWRRNRCPRPRACK